ncbi:MAG: cytochrome c [Roseovarius sp.]
MIRAASMTLASLAIFAATATAQEPDPENGRDLFLYFCAECHGKEAKGGGPVAPALETPPPDLTGIAARNGGTFPLGEVAMRIDGRAPVMAHGDMPVYGPYLESDAFIAMRLPDNQQMMMPVPLADVLAYLRSIQE